MKNLVFLYNDLLDENKQNIAKLPLEFVCFAYVKEAVMYEKRGNYYAIQRENLNTRYNKIYGAIYILDHSERNFRRLDALMTCSKSIIGSNHKYDIMHRTKVKARPIFFKNIEEFLKMKYNEKEGVEVTIYFANPNNNFIKTNVLNSVKNREVSGLDINNYINLVLEKEKRDERNNEFTNF